MTLRVVPLTLREANALVKQLHRHHKPVRGHRFSIGVKNDGKLIGAAIIGRPVARLTDQYTVAEVTRLVTDGTRNACSILYAAAARATRAMGYVRIQTFILETETGASLKAAGWWKDKTTTGGDGWKSRPNRRTDQPTCPKTRWVMLFHENNPEKIP